MNENEIIKELQKMTKSCDKIIEKAKDKEKANEMTDNEIIKALECCRDCKCKDCPCYNKETDGCKELDEQDILDLINRQQAEIEKLNKARQKQAVFLGEEREQKYELIDKLSKANTEIERLRAEADMAEGYADALVARAKSEAIKGFVEKVRKLWGNYDGYAFEGKFNELVKEMSGE